ncbi:MAG: 3-oxoacyl-ACP reductase, partial [Arthrobacter sp.]|nr:3-oxoacyl-ACP reductase [Arthrobacter sp.]
MDTSALSNPERAGRGVVVTGGASGIGAAIAAAFTDNGDRVVVMDRASGNGTIGVDVADEASVQAAFAEARERLGSVDVLVNSAGLLTESPLESMSLDTWNETIAVDLTGVFLCCREVVGGMRQQKWGRIINIASQLAIKGGVGLS